MSTIITRGLGIGSKLITRGFGLSFIGKFVRKVMRFATTISKLIKEDSNLQ